MGQSQSYTPDKSPHLNHFHTTLFFPTFGIPSHKATFDFFGYDLFSRPQVGLWSDMQPFLDSNVIVTPFQRPISKNLSNDKLYEYLKDSANSTLDLKAICTDVKLTNYPQIYNYITSKLPNDISEPLDELLSEHSIPYLLLSLRPETPTFSQTRGAPVLSASFPYQPIAPADRKTSKTNHLSVLSITPLYGLKPQFPQLSVSKSALSTSPITTPKEILSSGLWADVHDQLPPPLNINLIRLFGYDFAPIARLPHLDKSPAHHGATIVVVDPTTETGLAGLYDLMSQTCEFRLNGCLYPLIDATVHVIYLKGSHLDAVLVTTRDIIQKLMTIGFEESKIVFHYTDDLAAMEISQETSRSVLPSSYTELDRPLLLSKEDYVKLTEAFWKDVIFPKIFDLFCTQNLNYPNFNPKVHVNIDPTPKLLQDSAFPTNNYREQLSAFPYHRLDSPPLWAFREGEYFYQSSFAQACRISISKLLSLPPQELASFKKPWKNLANAVVFKSSLKCYVNYLNKCAKRDKWQNDANLDPIDTTGSNEIGELQDNDANNSSHHPLAQLINRYIKQPYYFPLNPQPVPLGGIWGGFGIARDNDGFKPPLIYLPSQRTQTQNLVLTSSHDVPLQMNNIDPRKQPEFGTFFIPSVSNQGDTILNINDDDVKSQLDTLPQPQQDLPQQQQQQQQQDRQQQAIKHPAAFDLSAFISFASTPLISDQFNLFGSSFMSSPPLPPTFESVKKVNSPHPALAKLHCVNKQENPALITRRNTLLPILNHLAISGPLTQLLGSNPQVPQSLQPNIMPILAPPFLSTIYPIGYDMTDQLSTDHIYNGPGAIASMGTNDRKIINPNNLHNDITKIQWESVPTTTPNEGTTNDTSQHRSTSINSATGYSFAISKCHSAAIFPHTHSQSALLSQGLALAQLPPQPIPTPNPYTIRMTYLLKQESDNAHLTRETNASSVVSRKRKSRFDQGLRLTVQNQVYHSQWHNDSLGEGLALNPAKYTFTVRILPFVYVNNAVVPLLLPLEAKEIDKTMDKYYKKRRQLAEEQLKQKHKGQKAEMDTLTGPDPRFPNLHIVPPIPALCDQTFVRARIRPTPPYFDRKPSLMQLQRSESLLNPSSVTPLGLLSNTFNNSQLDCPAHVIVLCLNDIVPDGSPIAGINRNEEYQYQSTTTTPEHLEKTFLKFFHQGLNSNIYTPEYDPITATQYSYFKTVIPPLYKEDITRTQFDFMNSYDINDKMEAMLNVHFTSIKDFPQLFKQIQTDAIDFRLGLYQYAAHHAATQPATGGYIDDKID